jgi:pimeloyl-ACP methyl ester carboxylesterase
MKKAKVHFHASENARANIVLSHAMYQDSSYLSRPVGNSFVDFLVSIGFNVYRLDLPGYYGEELDSDISFCTYVSELVICVEQIKSKSPLKLFIFGHSLSGLAAQVAAASSRVDGVISAAPSLWTFTKPISVYLNVLQYTKFLVAYALTKVFGHFPAHRVGLGNRPAPRGYILEYLKWILTRRFISPDNRIDYEKLLRESIVPTLYLWGPGDEKLAPRPNVEWVKSLGADRLATVMEVSQLNGYNFDADHFTVVYGRKAAQNVWPKIRIWLEGYLENLIKPSVSTT